MTEQEKQELSKAVADKYGIDAKAYVCFESHPPPRSKRTDIVIKPVSVWLHDDSARCFDLMVEHGLNITDLASKVKANLDGLDFHVHYCNHPTKQEATRIAILRALLAKD